MEISEVEELMENLTFVRDQMSIAVKNWKGTKPICSYEIGVIKEICEYPGKLNPLIFDPLLKWLADYILNREGKIAFTGRGGLDSFLRVGLRNIYNFIFLADFFSRNPNYFVPIAPSATLQAKKEAINKQAAYQGILDALSSKLIGCNEKLGFIFLKLSKTISVLPDDLKKMQSYLENQCLTYRKRNIKR